MNQTLGITIAYLFSQNFSSKKCSTCITSNRSIKTVLSICRTNWTSLWGTHIVTHFVDSFLPLISGNNLSSVSNSFWISMRCQRDIHSLWCFHLSKYCCVLNSKVLFITSHDVGLTECTWKAYQFWQLVTKILQKHCTLLLHEKQIDTTPNCVFKHERPSLISLNSIPRRKHFEDRYFWIINQLVNAKLC